MRPTRSPRAISPLMKPLLGKIMKQVWQACDNTIHQTQQECELHEAKRAHRGTILAYLRKVNDLPNIFLDTPEGVVDALLQRYEITLK